MNSSANDIQGELSRRHKALKPTVMGLIIATVLLSVVAYLSKTFLHQQNNPPLDMAVRITVLVLGLGSIVWRRTKFSAMRLQDIGSLQGGPGLLRTLEKTSLQLAFFG